MDDCLFVATDDDTTVAITGCPMDEQLYVSVVSPVTDRGCSLLLVKTKSDDNSSLQTVYGVNCAAQNEYEYEDEQETGEACRRR